MATTTRRPGSVYWIDHYTVPTNDLIKWKTFYEKVLGAELYSWDGFTTKQQLARAPLHVFMNMGRYHHNGGFLQRFEMTPSPGLGKSLPRYAYFTRQEDIDKHRRRLEEHQVAYSGPVQTSEEGAEGTAIYFEDPDGNGMEFWAPNHVPEGAIDLDNPVKLGRVSHVVQESRNLSRSAEFYSKYLGMDILESSDIPKDTLVMDSAGGIRLIFKKVEEFGPRTGSDFKFAGKHIAFTVPEDEFLTAYQRMWKGLPESEYKTYAGTELPDDTKMPAMTGLHGKVARGEWPNTYGRGTYVYDWDTSVFHLVGGKPVNGSMANYNVGSDAAAPPARGG